MTSLIERVNSRPRTTTLVATVMFSALAGLFLAAPASAYKLGGQRWPGKTARISYYDATPSSYRASVQQAILAWNTSGVRIKFVKAKTRRRAQVLIHKGPAIGPGTGFASVGYAQNASVELNKGGMDQWDYAGIVAHELGHVIGLDHPSRGCAAMTPAVYMFCKPEFPPHAWQWRCRLLQRDDLNGAKRRYGGRTRLRPSMWCDKAPPAGAPPALSVVQLSGQAARERAPHGDDPGPGRGLEVYRRLKTCRPERQRHRGRHRQRQSLEPRVDRPAVRLRAERRSYCTRLALALAGPDRGFALDAAELHRPAADSTDAILALTPTRSAPHRRLGVNPLMDILFRFRPGSARSTCTASSACATPQNPTGFDFVGERRCDRGTCPTPTSRPRGIGATRRSPPPPTAAACPQRAPGSTTSGPAPPRRPISRPSASIRTSIRPASTSAGRGG